MNKKVRIKRHPDERKVSLKELISTLPYSKEELRLLTLSENNSNDLVNLEVEAFNAMHGLYKDKQGKYTVKSLVVKLMHSKSY